jgi:hypothetical protein
VAPKRFVTPRSAIAIIVDRLCACE